MARSNFQIGLTCMGGNQIIWNGDKLVLLEEETMLGSSKLSIYWTTHLAAILIGDKHICQSIHRLGVLKVHPKFAIDKALAFLEALNATKKSRI